MAVDVELGEMC